MIGLAISNQSHCSVSRYKQNLTFSDRSRLISRSRRLPPLPKPNRLGRLPWSLSGKRGKPWNSSKSSRPPLPDRTGTADLTLRRTWCEREKMLGNFLKAGIRRSFHTRGGVSSSPRGAPPSRWGTVMEEAEGMCQQCTVVDHFWVDPGPRSLVFSNWSVPTCSRTQATICFVK